MTKNKDIIPQILKKPEHTDLVFDVEEKNGLLRTAMMGEIISLVEQPKSQQWMMFEILDFGEANEYSVIFKRQRNMQPTLFFEQPDSRRHQT